MDLRLTVHVTKKAYFIFLSPMDQIIRKYGKAAGHMVFDPLVTVYWLELILAVLYILYNFLTMGQLSSGLSPHPQA